MPNQVPEDVSKARIMELIKLVNSKTREQSAQYVGKTVEVLCEGFDDKKQMYLGRDEHGRMVYFPNGKNVVGEFLNVKISSANGISLMGDITDG